MSIDLTKRLARAVLIAGFVLPAALLASNPSSAAPPEPSDVTTPAAPPEAPVASTDDATVENFKKTLAEYGNFIKHDVYGEVWVPSVTPQGWHPYPPCQWVYAKDVGWYFRDDTPWGAIVHHYGRWSHDTKTGWFWVPDADWSPGWVVWRNSDKWIGWAPMPPEQEAKKVSLDDFNNDKMWIFMDAQQFVKGCGDTVLASKVYNETEPVSLFELPRGHIVDIRIVPRWKIRVIRRIIVIDRRCPPRRPHPNDNPRPTLYESLKPIDTTPPRTRIERVPSHKTEIIERHPIRWHRIHRFHKPSIKPWQRRHWQKVQIRHQRLHEVKRSTARRFR